MDLYELLKSKKEKLSIIGLGYVGIVLAIEFAKKLDTIGFDINKNKIEKYFNNHPLLQRRSGVAVFPAGDTEGGGQHVHHLPIGL